MDRRRRCLNPEDIYERYLDEIVIENKLAPSTSNIFTALAEELQKSRKAAYMLMKRVHDKRNNDADTSEETEIGENVVVPKHTALEQSHRLPNYVNQSRQKIANFFLTVDIFRTTEFLRLSPASVSIGRAQFQKIV